MTRCKRWAWRSVATTQRRTSRRDSNGYWQLPVRSPPALAGCCSTEPPPCLEVKSVTVRYGGVPALVNVDLNLARGELVAIVGANGAGKSTFLKAIAGIVPVARENGGKIRFDGNDITSRSPRDIVAA